MRKEIESEEETIPKLFVFVAIALAGLLSLTLFSEFKYVKATESAFVYDVNSGKPVDPINNPLQQFGPRVAWGWNARWFSVDSQLADYKFTGADAGSSKTYDDALEWNSTEGVGMRVDYRMFGQVQDPWRFFMHYGHLEYNYDSGSVDRKIYSALRQAGKKMDEYINNYAATNKAEFIRSNPDTMRAGALLKTQEYMSQYGFQVTDVQFLSNFAYSNGDLVQKARQQVTEVNTAIAVKQQELLNQANRYKIDADQAKIDADNAIAAANREASFIHAETLSLATAISQSIEQIGVEGTMKLFVTERYGDIIEHGVVPLVIVDETSLFAAPFYPANTASKTTPVNATDRGVNPKVLVAKP